jgi:hypothetical protein
LQRTKYALTTTFIPIPATVFSRQVRYYEDGSVASVGISLKYPDDNYTNAISYLSARQPAIQGNVVAEGRGEGPMVGYPAQSGSVLTPRAATTLVMAAALSGTTTLVVEEID